MAFIDYYLLLGVSPEASTAEIQTAFRKAAQRYDPNTHPGLENESIFNSVLDAYATLNDPAKRAAYNEKFAAELSGNHSQTNDFLEKVGAGKRAKILPMQPEPKPPTFTQLLDFDWDALEEKPVTTKAQKRAFLDQVYFKVAIIAIVVAVVALLLWLLRNP